MSVIVNNILTNSHREEVYTWATTNEHLGEFNNTSTSTYTSRQAFSATFTRNNLPEVLDFFECNQTNIYNIICIITFNSGDIPEHTDDDLTCYMRELRLPEIFIKLPHTTSVYYVDICPRQKGGETIFGDERICPEVNSILTFPSSTPHSVTAITGALRPRVAIVCEKYKLLKPALELIKTPTYRPG